MSHEVFISYSSLDKNVAEQLCTALEASGTVCWIAPRDVMPGKPYGEALIDAINDSHVMLLVMSESSNHSQQVVREVERAASKGIPIIPFRIAEVRLAKSLEYFLSTCHWLDAFNGPLEKHIPKLVESVNATLRSVYDGSTLPSGPHALPPKSRSILRANRPKALLVDDGGSIYDAELVDTSRPSGLREPSQPPRRPAPPPFPPGDQHKPQTPATRPSNGLGIAGLTTSILGVFTCGTFSPIGLLLSLIALVKPPRGSAIAGSIVGAIGTGIFMAMFAYGFYGGFFTALALDDAALHIEAYRADRGDLPDDTLGKQLVACEKDAWNRELRYTRTWSGYEIRSAGLDGSFDTSDDHTVMR
jgi:hypothetical protein